MGAATALAAFLSIAELSGNGVGELIRKVLGPVLSRSTKINRTPENQELIESLEEKTEKVLREHVYLKATLSGEFLQVREDEVWGLVVDWLKELDVLLRDGKVHVDFDNFNSLPRDQQIHLIEQYGAIPVEWKNKVLEHCQELYPVITKFHELANNLELKDYHQGQGSSYPQQNRVSRGVRYTEIELGYLPARNNPKFTVREYYQQREDGSSLLYSYDEASTVMGPTRFGKALVNQAGEQMEMVQQEYEAISSKRAETALVNQAREQMERAQQEYNKIVDQAKSSALSQEPTGIGSLTVSKPFESADNLRYPPIRVRPFSNQEGTSRPENSNAQDQLVPRDKPLGASDYSPNYSPGAGASLRHNLGSPVEKIFEGNQLLVCIISGLGASILVSTIQIAWVILRKLEYTQELVNKLTDRGVPKSLFFFVRHPNPGPVGGKPLFTLLIGILMGNIIVLYFFLKIIYLLF